MSALALDVIGDILTHSVFDAGELAREKGVILQEYAAVEDTPDDVVYDAFMEAAFPASRSAGRSSGSPRRSRASTQAGIRAFIAREYTPDRWCWRPPATSTTTRSWRRPSGISAPPAVQGPPPRCRAAIPGGERRMPRKLEQANLVIGLPGLSFKDPAYYAAHLFAQVLGGGLTSRLWHEVRETRGLAYSIEAFHWPFSDCGLFGIGAGTSRRGFAELVDGHLGRHAPGGGDLERRRDRPRQGAAEGRAALRAGDARRPHRPQRPPAPGLGPRHSRSEEIVASRRGDGRGRARGRAAAARRRADARGDRPDQAPSLARIAARCGG